MVLDNLEPSSVFAFFEQLCAIPHGSGNTKSISDWLVLFARERGLVCRQDEWNNIILFKNASPGCEAAAPIILQAHMDMVCEKRAGCPADMSRDGLTLLREGDTIRADGTSLGADDGIGVAMILAILDARDIAHPAIEAVITADEEIGMVGANAIDVGMLRGRRMLNLDSSTEGVFTVGCAGGNNTTGCFPIRRTGVVQPCVRITVSGLTGGHSGEEIDKGRANANLLLGYVLQMLWDCSPYALVSVNGGLKSNTIPQSAEAVAAVDLTLAAKVCRAAELALRGEYGRTDPRLTVSVQQCEPSSAMDRGSTERVLAFLAKAPNGVIAYSTEFCGAVETSLNLGILRTAEDHVESVFGIRSSSNVQKERLVENVRRLLCVSGGDISVSGDYPGWIYPGSSPLVEQMNRAFYLVYGHYAGMRSVHAGIECGVFAKKIDGLDAVSMGVQMEDIHTCRERVSIASVQRVWQTVILALEEMSTESGADGGSSTIK